jgi:hypothetical protein
MLNIDVLPHQLSHAVVDVSTAEFDTVLLIDIQFHIIVTG